MVSHMISTMQFFGLFYKFSPKRQSKIDISISLRNPGNSVLKSKVKTMYETCWLEIYINQFSTVLSQFNVMMIQKIVLIMK